MNCWDRFDMKISLCFTGNADRVPPLDAELGRVGLKPDLRIWNCPCPYEDVAVSCMRPTRAMAEHAGFRNSGFGHYRAVRTAYELGAKSVLVLEDDVRFLRDAERVSGIVEAMPDGANTWLFDMIRGGRDDLARLGREMSARAADGWAVPPDWSHPRSLACYAMNRDGMREFLRCLVDAYAGRRRLRLADHYLQRDMGGIRVATAWPLACVQVPVGRTNNSAAYYRGGVRDAQLADYAEMGLDLSEYQT